MKIFLLGCITLFTILVVVNKASAQSNIISGLNGILRLPQLRDELSSAKTVGEAQRMVLNYIKQYFDPNIDVEGMISNTKEMYGAQIMDTPFTLDSQIYSELASLLMNFNNTPDIYSSILNLLYRFNGSSLPSRMSTMTNQFDPINPLMSLFPNLAQQFLTQLFSQIPADYLKMVLQETIKTYLTPDVLETIKGVIQMTNPELYEQIKDINDPQVLYPLISNTIDEFIMSGFLQNFAQMFGIDLNDILFPSTTYRPPTTYYPGSTPSQDEYLAALKDMLTELNSSSWLLGTPEIRLQIFAQLFGKYPIVFYTLRDRLRTTQPLVYEQLMQNNGMDAVRILLPYIPQLLNSDLQSIKETYGMDFSYLLSLLNAISTLPSMPPTSTSNQPTNPPSSPPPTNQPTNPPSTPPPTNQPTNPPSTPPPTNQPTNPQSTTTFNILDWLNNLITTTTRQTTIDGTTTSKKRPIFG